MASAAGTRAAPAAEDGVVLLAAAGAVVPAPAGDAVVVVVVERGAEGETGELGVVETAEGGLVLALILMLVVGVGGDTCVVTLPVIDVRPVGVIGRMEARGEVRPFCDESVG